MKKVQDAEIAVIGAGIVGLATAYHLAKKGKRVVLFERNEMAVSASCRNFGLVWPIGQKAGINYERAMRSRSIWLELAKKADLQAQPVGSLQLVHHADELAVIEEFASTAQQNGYDCTLFTPSEVLQKSPAVKAEGLKGALFSPVEVMVNPRQAIWELPKYLEQLGVILRFGQAVNQINMPQIETRDEVWNIEKVFVCSGADFETLYPEVFADSNITKCKLQMLRTVGQPDNWKLGPALCAGLTLAHYASFSHCKTLEVLKKRFESEMAEYVKWGIHVLVSQNGEGELTLGDSHEYGLSFDPFDKTFINQLILEYLNSFAHFPKLQIAQSWHGIYPKLKNGNTELIVEPEKDVMIINGMGGAGMTLSFGMTHDIIEKFYGSVAIA
ncbi:TIGR03364 family FAD-dependent oxidoreductase [Solitalea lacus]|uniref:TIGR03364 family FAD-dependent oxidoreductase n=1 Tax=Solitalea lacus TaxID=2911172 RepID=UPI001EDB1DF9|nr:TIGR03364 family FAD-dependent oxidoreductase [Solitalea lacus]UKJ08167.1 TIGR03364 family FAD-dependent oxidoreductase [Solitalea lacus]